MPQHYTKNTVSVSVWCNACGKATMHRVDDRRRGPCLECIAKQEQAATQPKYERGTCRICGCTQRNACLNLFGEPCSWADHTQTLCDNPDCLAEADVQSRNGGPPAIAAARKTRAGA